MRIVANRFYTLRDGRRAGEIGLNTHAWHDDGRSFNSGLSSNLFGDQRHLDIVAGPLMQ